MTLTIAIHENKTDDEITKMMETLENSDSMEMETKKKD